MKWTPEPYQKEGVKRLIKNSCHGLFWKPGISKTSAVLDAFCKVQNKNLVGRGLVISNAEIISKGGPWHGEVSKWDNFNHLKLVTLHGPKKDKLALEDADIYLLSCHVASLEWFFFKNNLHKKLGIDWMIIDESSFFKDHSTAAFKGYPKKKINGRWVRDRFPGLRNYVGHFARRTILTGDPSTNGLESLWSQIYLLDEGSRLGQYKTHFYNRFYSIGYNGWDKTPLPTAEKEIYSLIDDLVHIVDDDVLPDLPALEFHRVPVKLPKKAKDLYDSMFNDFVVEVVRGGRVVAPSKAVSGGYLRQIANGGLYYKETTVLNDGRELKGPQKIQQIHNAKNKELLKLLKKLEYKQCIVAYEFDHDLKRIKKDLDKLKHVNVVYYTTNSRVKRDQIKRAWNGGVIDVLVTQVTRLSHGLNLQESNAFNVCLYSQSWRVEAINQLVRRVRRRGNDAEFVNVWCLIAEDTLDEAVFDNMSVKNMKQQNLFDSLKRYTLTRANKYRAKK